MHQLNGTGTKVEENWLLKQMEEIKQRQEQLLNLQLKLQEQLQKQSPNASPDSVNDSHKITPSSSHLTPTTTKLSPCIDKTPSTPATTTSQSYADFIAAHVEDISPYVPDNNTSRMPFELAVGAEREAKRVRQAIENEDDNDQSVPFAVAQSVLDDSLKTGCENSNLQTPSKSSIAWSPAVYSPKPVMAGLHQLLQSVSPAPIQTPLALRSMAERTQPQRDLLEISSTENSVLETSKLFPTPEYVSDASQQTINVPKTPVRGVTPEYRPHSSQQTASVLKTPVQGPSGQVSSSSLMTTTLSFSSPYSGVKSSKGSLSLAANLKQDTAQTVMSPFASIRTTPIKQTETSISSPVQLKSAKSPEVRLRQGKSPDVGLRQSTILAQTVARFHDALLDDEVALYACRMARKRTASDVERTIVNPIANTLSQGDEMVSTKDQFACFLENFMQLHTPTQSPLG